jgi:hypothetical protein
MEQTRMNPEIVFEKFPKMPRYSRECIISEKIDGTNAQVLITEAGEMLTGSRSRWITPEDDNFGFAKWCDANYDELLKLGPGRHFGEWWGRKIQRGYNIPEKRFSLFNVARWHRPGFPPFVTVPGDPGLPPKESSECPACCDVVPVLTRGPFNSAMIERAMLILERNGSLAAPGFMKPEGIVIFHTASNSCFKKTFEGDDSPKKMLARS